MELFDQHIIDVRTFVTRKRKYDACLRVIECARSAEQLLKGLSAQYNGSNQPFVVLKEDTFVELGNPLQGSSSMLLWSRQPELIQDGNITIIGPDIPESEGRSLPFGQVIMIGGTRLKEEDLAKMERASDISHRLEGYMIRQMLGKLWSRISNAAAKKGFSFKTLGSALMLHYRMQFVELEAIEILFVTRSKEDVAELEAISREAKSRSYSIRKLVRTGDGTYECNDLNCDVCPDRSACETIREVLVIRKGGKVAEIKVLRGERQDARSTAL